jgi:hypothetical protein
MSSHALVLDVKEAQGSPDVAEGVDKLSSLPSATSAPAEGVVISPGSASSLGGSSGSGGGLGALYCGNTLVGFGALASQGKICFNFGGSDVFSGT